MNKKMIMTVAMSTGIRMRMGIRMGMGNGMGICMGLVCICVRVGGPGGRDLSSDLIVRQS